MITKIDNYILNEENKNNENLKLKMTLDVFDLVKFIGGSDDININIPYRKHHNITKIYIKKFEGFEQDLFVELTTILDNYTFDVGFLSNLNIKEMTKVYNYLKNKYPDEYNQIIVKKESEKFNI